MAAIAGFRSGGRGGGGEGKERRKMGDMGKGQEGEKGGRDPSPLLSLQPGIHSREERRLSRGYKLVQATSQLPSTRGNRPGLPR